MEFDAAHKIVGIGPRQRMIRSLKAARILATFVSIKITPISQQLWLATVTTNPLLFASEKSKKQAHIKLRRIVIHCLRYVEIDDILTHPFNLI